MSVTATAIANSTWTLVGRIDDQENIQRVVIGSTPFSVGRSSGADLRLPFPTVSGEHAEFLIHGEALWLRDVGSKNGTYLNGQRLAAPARLREGDIVQFAEVVLRLDSKPTNTNCDTMRAEGQCDEALALLQFERLMTERALLPHFQPIVLSTSRRVIGFEALARSRLLGLQNPGSMFLAAQVLELEAEFSQMCRVEGLHASAVLPSLSNIFLNTHPAELADPAPLIESLRQLRALDCGRRITLEIHEAAVAGTRTMRRLRDALRELDIALAYDDFGAGQARLLELIDVRPDYLKFDIGLIRGIHKASHDRQRMLAALVKMSRELGIAPLAEGVECEAEGEACRQLGFELGQGYFYGRPAPAASFLTAL